ncbi:hypothetical protein HDU96_001076 [Phlyctochytrium bullatum]|nr:hypothetical protein HDU96_001076 [Phlyctochytrium bullatum]
MTRPTTRLQLTGTAGITTTLATAPTNTQAVPPVTTTIQLAALEASQPEGVEVTTAVAIVSMTSIASAFVFAFGLFAVWTYRMKRAKGKEGVHIQRLSDGADVASRPERTPSNGHLDGAAADRSVSNKHTDNDLFATSVTPVANGDLLRESSLDEKEALGELSQPEAAASTQLVVIMPGNGTSQSGSQSISSQSREDVLLWSSGDVRRWMDSVGFRTEVVEMFKAHHIDGPRLLGLTDNILENEIGITSVALRSSILSVRARFFLQPHLPADAVASAGPSATPRHARRRQDAAATGVALLDNGVLRTVVSANVLMNVGSEDLGVDDAKVSGTDEGSEPPPDYGVQQPESEK